MRVCPLFGLFHPPECVGIRGHDLREPGWQVEKVINHINAATTQAP